MNEDTSKWNDYVPAASAIYGVNTEHARLKNV
jgi:hypothetical protein